MPILNASYPGPPLWQWNGHVQTIAPALASANNPYQRERLELADGDFLDLDWLRHEEADQLLLLTHGLEGNSTRPYMLRMAHYFHERGWDVLAWNCRSCSGEINRNFRLYHHGEIEDIGRVIQYALASKPYRQMSLIGFSMGGAMSLKYLGVHGDKAPEVLTSAIAFSTPCDLGASAAALEWSQNRFYKKRFLKSLSQKMLAIDQNHRGILPIHKLNEVRQWRDFDEWFTTILSGSPSANAFYEMASAQHYMPGIRRRTLLVNAVNDPILPQACTPYALCASHPYIFLETPRRGGHVGFSLPGKPNGWMAERAWEFIGS
jgi:hypothetical protein